MRKPKVVVVTTLTSVGLQQKINQKFEESEKYGLEVFDVQIFWKKNQWYAYIFYGPRAPLPQLGRKTG